jgi:hypothetical protein
VVGVGGGGGGHLPGRLVEISPRPSGGGGPARLGPSASFSSYGPGSMPPRSNPVGWPVNLV